MPRHNEAVAQLLDNIARLLTLQHADPYRVRAYSEASRTIERLPDDVLALHEAGELRSIEGVGASIAAWIGEYLDTGHSSRYEQLKREIAPEASDLLEVPSIGPERARLIHDQLAISTLPELERAAREHRLRALPGVGEALEQRIGEEAARAAERVGPVRQAIHAT
jgi:DNA polymerase (family 10)